MLMFKLIIIDNSFAISNNHALIGLVDTLTLEIVADRDTLARRCVPVMRDNARGSCEVLELIKPRYFLLGGIFKGCGLGHQSEE